MTTTRLPGNHQLINQSQVGLALAKLPHLRALRGEDIPAPFFEVDCSI
jgi:hypothetical protein